MLPIDTHAGRVAHAVANRTCFACANYRGQFATFTAVCARGGLDPERSATAPSEQIAAIWATVSWANTCPRFVAALSEQVAA